jgi:hypothetical protein
MLLLSVESSCKVVTKDRRTRTIRLCTGTSDSIRCSTRSCVSSFPGCYGAWRYNSFTDGVLILGFLRWAFESHATWCVNSVAHSFGDRPYKHDIRPCESTITSMLGNGEGWHNWHHAFPFDYATSEYGVLKQWNPTKLLIDILSCIGQAYDLKRHVHRMADSPTREHVTVTATSVIKADDLF